MEGVKNKRKQQKLEYNRNWKRAKRALLRTTSTVQLSSSSDSDHPEPEYHHRVTSAFTVPVVNQNFNNANNSEETMQNNEDDTWDWSIIEDHDVCDSDTDVENETHIDTVNANDESLCASLAGWTNECQIKHNAVDKLLKILQQHGHNGVPGTARTLLKTERHVTPEVKSGMDYLHYPLINQLIRTLDKYPREVTENLTELEISLNIDGLPLFKSSSKTVWPILCAVHLEPISIFPTAITYGESKPCNLDFLHDALNDVNNLIQNGLLYCERRIRIELRCVVCDAPAKAMVKGIKLYSGYYGCDRCEQKGAWLGRITYQDTDNLSLRTNDSFRRQTNPEHHNVNSPFCDIQIDMIKQYPIDYMHQCCLGVMKRLLLLWLRGKKEVKMSAMQAEQVSSRLQELQRFIPSAFARKPRSFREIDRWKATEYRQFMLYTGKIVLKGLIKDDLYLHFMTFSVAMCILISRNLVKRYHQYAGDLLKYFVEKGGLLYGPEFLVYNVHSMLHLSKDAVEFGSLNEISAFPFENFLQKIKRMVRSGKQPLIQIAKRLDEIENVPLKKQKNTLNTISTRRPNNAYYISDTSCCEVLSFTNVEDDNNRKVMCRVYRCEPLQTRPCNTSIIGALKARDRDSRVKIMSVALLKEKAIMIEKDNGIRLFLALLHDF